MSNMGPGLEPKGRSYISQETPGSKKHMAVMKELESNQMNCSKNCAYKNPEMQVRTIEQTEVETKDTLEGTISGGMKPLHEGWDPAVTESSSSFDSDGTSFSDNEVSSELFDNALPAFPFDDYGDLFRIRKKKLTSSWRKYIGPLMWRCKWVELQIKKFESQAQKYDREIGEYNRRKPLESCIPENVNTKSLPFDAQSQSKAVMKRKKRRRAEDLDNIESFMSHHNLFSYFENKKAAADAACGNQGADKTSNDSSGIRIDDELLSREFKDGGNSLEQIFWKIGIMQCKVSEMKNRAHKVLSENALRVCSTENFSSIMPFNNNTLTSSTEKPTFTLNDDPNMVFTQENDTNMVSEIVTGDIESDNSDIKMVDISMPETQAAAVGDGEVTPVLDNIKIINSPVNEGSSKNTNGAMLMYNRRAKTNQSKSKETDIIITENPDRANQDHENSVVPVRQDPGSSTPKVRSISEMISSSTSGATSNKRRRATRKARVWIGKLNN